MQRSKLPIFFLILAAVLALVALGMLVRGLNSKPPLPPTGQAPVPAAPGTPPIAPATPERPAVIPAKPTAPTTPPVAPATPAELVNQIAKALEAGDQAALQRLLGKAAADPATAERLKALIQSGLKPRAQDALREIGELELNARTRWSLTLDGQTGPLLLDLRREGDHWTVDKLTLPPLPTDPKTQDPAAAPLPDALSVADAFLQATLRQQFELARTLVNSTTVSDAKIAGICILFEEGQYQLRQSKPLRAMLQRPNLTGFLTYVEAANRTQSAQFTLTVQRRDEHSGWLVSEINLDQLLGDYAQRVAGGDVYYSPLVKNPSGGDTLALYFEFDQDQVNPRTRRQLEIVSRILRADPGKKITLSGHTDALGTADYNQNLSARRAEVVAQFLTAAGVAADQIVMVAKGASQPRRPNVTETGQDNPEGRRANRRTEIYLDF